MKYKLYRKHYGLHLTTFIVASRRRKDRFTASILHRFQNMILRKYHYNKLTKAKKGLLRAWKYSIVDPFRRKRWLLSCRRGYTRWAARKIVYGYKYLSAEKRLYSDLMSFDLRIRDNSKAFSSRGDLLTKIKRYSGIKRRSNKTARKRWLYKTLGRKMNKLWWSSDVKRSSRRYPRRTERSKTGLSIWEFTKPLRRVEAKNWVRARMLEYQLAAYYGFASVRRFRAFQSFAGKRSRINMNSIFRFEGTIINILRRSTLFPPLALYAIRELLGRGEVCINGRVVRDPYSATRLGDIISIQESKIVETIGMFINWCLARNRPILNSPAYMLVSRKLCAVCLWRLPFKYEIIGILNPLAPQSLGNNNSVRKHEAPFKMGTRIHGGGI